MNWPRAGRAPLTPRRRCLPAPGIGHSGEKTVSGRAALESWSLFCKGRWRQLVFQKTIIARAPREILSDKLFVYRLDFLLRRGARWFERTGLKPAGLRFRRGGAPIGRLIGLTVEEIQQKLRTGAASWRYIPPAEKFTSPTTNPLFQVFRLRQVVRPRHSDRIHRRVE